MVYLGGQKESEGDEEGADRETSKREEMGKRESAREDGEGEGCGMRGRRVRGEREMTSIICPVNASDRTLRLKLPQMDNA